MSKSVYEYFHFNLDGDPSCIALSERKDGANLPCGWTLDGEKPTILRTEYHPHDQQEIAADVRDMMDKFDQGLPYFLED